MGNRQPIIDVVEAGSGPHVVLVHSSMAGARQWRRLMGELEDRFHLFAVNLFGYGHTPAWHGQRSQALDDQAGLIAAAVPDDGRPLCLIGHSFGASVAMKAAANLGRRVDKLVLLEPTPFYLLHQHGRCAAYAEAAELRDWVKQCGTSGDWQAAARKFVDYWGGAGTWAATPDERKPALTEAIRPNFHEWDALMDEATTLEEWAGIQSNRVLVLSARNTLRPIREIIRLLRIACPAWRFEQLDDGGHMAPLRRPDLVNPRVAAFLDET
jgi:pimeloyl-ACP methyl ester carboxylesterase